MLVLRSLILLGLTAACAVPVPRHIRNATLSSGDSFDDLADLEEPDEPPLDHPWSCGTDAFSLIISESSITSSCPELKNNINNCCVWHDDCYDRQRGRHFCDDTFCNCLASETVSNRQCHDSETPLFCTLVQELGDSAYAASGSPGNSSSAIEGSGSDQLTALSYSG